MKTVIYARKSSESEDRQVQSIEDQLSALRVLAKREHITIAREIHESCSAKEPFSRPEFVKLVEDINAGRVDSVLTWSINRLSRNQVDGGYIGHLLQTGKLRWIQTIDRRYLPEDNAILISIENGMATSFLQDLQKNVKRGMEGKASRGWLPGRAPIGYINDPYTKQIVPDPERFALVRAAWDLMLSGAYTKTEAFEEMKRRGLTSHSRRQNRYQLSRHAFFSLFTNPFYKGEFRFRGNVLPGLHEPMVTASEFQTVQAICGRSIDRRPQRHSHAFAGVFRCAKCGCRIVGDRRVKFYRGTDRTAEYRYYHCTNGRGGCSKRGVLEASLTELVRTAFKEIELPSWVVNWAKAESIRLCERESGARRKALGLSVMSRLKLEQRLERLHEMRMDHEIDSAAFVAMKAKLEGKLLDLDRALQTGREQEEEIQNLVVARLDLAGRAGGFEHEEGLVQRAMVASLAADHYLNLEKLQFALDPVLQKIAAFGRAIKSSGKQKAGPVVPTSSAWSAYIEDIQTAARLEITRKHAAAQSQTGDQISTN